jgi:hypothetical protein
MQSANNTCRERITVELDPFLTTCVSCSIWSSCIKLCTVSTAQLKPIRFSMLLNRRVFKERSCIPLMPRHFPSWNGYKRSLRMLKLDRGSTQIIGKPLRNVRRRECESHSVLCCCSLVFNDFFFSSMGYLRKSSLLRSHSVGWLEDLRVR